MSVTVIGVGVLAARVAVGDAAPPPVPGLAVDRAFPGAGVACCDWANGHVCKLTGKFVQLPFVQIFSMTGVLARPLQSTTCLPLFTSIVEQPIVFGVLAEDVGEIS